MKKLNLLNILILVTTVLFSTAEAFGNTTAVQTLSVSAQDAVTIEKVSGGVESGNIYGETGKHGGLSTSFTLQVNDVNTENIFVVGSMIADYYSTNLINDIISNAIPRIVDIPGANTITYLYYNPAITSVSSGLIMFLTIVSIIVPLTAIRVMNPVNIIKSRQ